MSRPCTCMACSFQLFSQALVQQLSKLPHRLIPDHFYLTQHFRCDRLGWLQRSMDRLGHQFRGLLRRRLVHFGQGGVRGYKTRDNGAIHLQLLLQALVRAQCAFRPEKFEQLLPKQRFLPHEKTQISLAVLQQFPQYADILRKERFRERARKGDRESMLEHLAQIQSLRVVIDPLLDSSGSLKRLAQNQRHKQVFSRLPVQVDRTLCHSGQSGDIIYSSLFVPPTFDQLSGSIQNAVRPFLALRSFLPQRPRSLDSCTMTWQNSLLLDNRQ